jgi:hypothetical protein
MHQDYEEFKEKLKRFSDSFMRSFVFHKLTAEMITKMSQGFKAFVYAEGLEDTVHVMTENPHNGNEVKVIISHDVEDGEHVLFEISYGKIPVRFTEIEHDVSSL